VALAPSVLLSGDTLVAVATTTAGDPWIRQQYTLPTAGDSFDRLYVAHCLDATCSSTRVSNIDSAPSVGGDLSYPSIAVDASGHALIAYNLRIRNGHPTVKVAACGDADCTSATGAIVGNQEVPFGGMWRPATARGSDGLPVISYLGDSSRFLYVGHCTNATCTAATSATAADLGVLPPNPSTVRQDLAIGSDGFPVVSYFIPGFRDMAVAHCRDAVCSAAEVNVIDELGDVGHSNSLIIGNDGFPLITYSDGATGHLKMAHCRDAACSSTTISVVEPS
jgi:hypothetical protein